MRVRGGRLLLFVIASRKIAASISVFLQIANADQRPLLEQREDVFVRNHGDLRLADSTNRVIHFFDKERLRVRQIARDVKR